MNALDSIYRVSQGINNGSVVFCNKTTEVQRPHNILMF